MATSKGPKSSREFTELIKAVGESKSKSEEDLIIKREVELLKQRINAPRVDKNAMKEFLIRMAYVEMLGHDASEIGYVHATNFAKEPNLLFKKVGYLAATLFLDERHELRLMFVGTIQNDLHSDNYLAVASALTATCKLINADMVPAVLPNVVDLIKHPKELVRKKAVMALHRFHAIAPESVDHHKELFRAALCDKDPSVMSASLCALYDLLKAEPAAYKNLVPSFVSVLKQVAEHRLPKGYDYHRSPAPFIQIKLLRILGVLGSADRATSEQMYSVLGDVLKKGGVAGNTIGHAVVFECVRTITSIYPDPQLLAASSEVLSRFLTSKQPNLRYAGVDALGHVVKINAKYAAEYQMAVIDCLESTDETLKKKTLELLFKMTKPANVEVIVEKMIDFLRGVVDTHVKADIVARVTELAERYAPDNRWFVATMNQVFELGGECVKPAAAHNLMRLIAEGSEEDEEDEALRVSAVASYLELLDKPSLPEVLLQVIVWVLGEYGGLAPGHTPNEVILRLCEVVDRTGPGDAIKGYVVTAIGKLAAQAGGALPADASALLEGLASSRSADLQQRAHELLAILGGPTDALAAVLPADASCEDVEVDPNLGFVQSYVDAALASGAAPYAPPEDRLGAVDVGGGGGGTDAGAAAGASSGAGGLRFDAYEPAVRAPEPVMSAASGGGDGAGGGAGGAAGGAGAGEPDPGALRLNTGGGPRKWGRQQYAPEPAAGGGEMDDAALAAMLQAEEDARAAAAGYDLHAEAEAMAANAHAAHGVGGGPSGATEEVHGRGDREPSSEKERMAASLFGGGGGGGLLGGGGSSSASSRARAPRTAAASAAPRPKPAAAAAPASAAPPPAAMDLLMDLDDPGPGTAAPGGGGGAGVDLMSELEGLSVGGAEPPPAASQPSQPAPAPALNIDALYGPPAGGMGQPGVMPGMGMQPGMMPGMQPGMMPGMGMQPGMMRPGMPGMGGGIRPPMGGAMSAPPQQPAQPVPAPPPKPKDDLFNDLLG